LDLQAGKRTKERGLGGRGRGFSERVKQAAKGTMGEIE